MKIPWDRSVDTLGLCEAACRFHMILIPLPHSAVHSTTLYWAVQSGVIFRMLCCWQWALHYVWLMLMVVSLTQHKQTILGREIHKSLEQGLSTNDNTLLEQRGEFLHCPMACFRILRRNWLNRWLQMNIFIANLWIYYGTMWRPVQEERLSKFTPSRSISWPQNTLSTFWESKSRHEMNVLCNCFQGLFCDEFVGELCTWIVCFKTYRIRNSSFGL